MKLSEIKRPYSLFDFNRDLDTTEEPEWNMKKSQLVKGMYRAVERERTKTRKRCR